MNRWLQTFSVGLVVLGGALAGCEQPGQKLVVGRVDTAVIIQNDPEYSSQSIDYLREQTEVKQAFIEGIQKAGSDSAKEAARKKYEEAQKQLNEKWSTRTREFLKARHEAINTAVEEISQAKNIDMVLLDSQYYPTVEWGAIDITQDVQLKMVDKPQGGGQS